MHPLPVSEVLGWGRPSVLPVTLPNCCPHGREGARGSLRSFPAPPPASTGCIVTVTVTKAAQGGLGYRSPGPHPRDSAALPRLLCLQMRALSPAGSGWVCFTVYFIVGLLPLTLPWAHHSPVAPQSHTRNTRTFRVTVWSPGGGGQAPGPTLDWSWSCMLASSGTRPTPSGPTALRVSLQW